MVIFIFNVYSDINCSFSHLLFKDDFAQNQEFITLVVYKNDGKKVYYPSMYLINENLEISKLRCILLIFTFCALNTAGDHFQLVSLLGTTLVSSRILCGQPFLIHLKDAHLG